MISESLERPAAIPLPAWSKALALAVALLPGLLRAGPQISLPDIDGAMHRLSDYRGKWVLVNYWATWCPPCLEELPELEIFHATHQDKDAVVLGVDTEDISIEALRRFVDEQSLTYPILRGDAAGRTPFGLVQGMPTSFLIDPQGNPVARQEGPVTARAIEDFIASHGDQARKTRP